MFQDRLRRPSYTTPLGNLLMMDIAFMSQVIPSVCSQYAAMWLLVHDRRVLVETYV